MVNLRNRENRAHTAKKQMEYMLNWQTTMTDLLVTLTMTKLIQKSRTEIRKVSKSTRQQQNKINEYNKDQNRKEIETHIITLIYFTNVFISI